MLFCFLQVLSSDIWLIINLDKQQGQSCCSDWLGKNSPPWNNDPIFFQAKWMSNFAQVCGLFHQHRCYKTYALRSQSTYKSDVFPWGGNVSQYECLQMLLQCISPISFPSVSWHLWDHIYVLRATFSLSMLRFANWHLAESTSENYGSIISFRGI